MLFWVVLLEFAPKARLYLKIIEGKVEALTN